MVCLKRKTYELFDMIKLIFNLAIKRRKQYMKKIITLCFASTFLMTGACSNTPTFGDQLKSSGQEYQAMGQRWEDGQEKIDKGEKLVKQGEKEIKSGEKKVSKGQKMIKEGRAQIREVESSYKQ
jgi:peptidoglycan hydrolase CwlO-like protein